MKNEYLTRQQLIGQPDRTRLGEQFDSEVVLGAVISWKGKNISEEDVLGYCIANDLSSCRES